MKHYNNTRVARERMPGRREGQVLGKAAKKYFIVDMLSSEEVTSEQHDVVATGC